MAATDNFASVSRRPKPGTLGLIVLLHFAAIYALARAFAPQTTASIEDAVLSSITVTVETKQYEAPLEPRPESEPDAGDAGAVGRKAVPKAVTAPERKVVIKPNPPAPKASSTGSANSAGALETGNGTGAGGPGGGTGSGAGGSGQSGGIATPPIHVSGGINNARDYPLPPGGRNARIGSEVVVKVTVGPDGRASNCAVFKPSPDPEADRITCRLVMNRLRFRPATDSGGKPVAAPFYWRQRWF